MNSADQQITELEAANSALQQRVAELEQHLATLTTERNLLHTLVDQMPDLLYAKDTQLRFVFSNHSILTHFGFDQSTQLLGKSDADVFPVEFAQSYAAVEREVLASGQAQREVEQETMDANGKRHWLLSSKLPWYDQEGKLIGLIGVGRDITARREAELALIQQREALEVEVAARAAEIEAREAQFRTLFELAPVGIGISRQGTTLQANPAYLHMFGYPDAEVLVGTSLLNCIAPSARAAMVERVRQRENNNPVEQSYTSVGLRSDGSEFPMLLEVARMPLADGQLGSVAFISDLSALQQAEEQRLALQEQVIAAQQEALRELSTPLVPIANEIVAMPLVGAIDDARAQQIMETLLEGIVAQQASFAILDITGVRVVDTQVADALLRVAKATTLLGAQVILTGIGADVAQALVTLGADLGDIVTRSNLQAGIAYALSHQG